MLNQNSSCQLDIKSIVNPSFDIHFPLVKQLLVDFWTSFLLAAWMDELILNIISIIQVMNSWWVILEELNELVGNLAVRCTLVLDDLLHHLQTKLLQTSWHLLGGTPVVCWVVLWYSFLRVVHFLPSSQVHDLRILSFRLFIQSANLDSFSPFQFESLVLGLNLHNWRHYWWTFWKIWGLLLLDRLKSWILSALYFILILVKWKSALDIKKCLIFHSDRRRTIKRSIHGDLDFQGSRLFAAKQLFDNRALE